MLERFKKHIKDLDCFNTEGKILIAVSGGVDSMVLCHLMSKANFQFDVSHINHNTRNGESNHDEMFVSNYFKQQNVNVLIHHIRHNAKGNFHDWAHRQRYDYWHSLDYEYILTAHHKDDHLETILINFFNGRSILGIPSKNDKIVRLLLPFYKKEILQYASDNKIPYVEDSSNQSQAYFRNLIRQTITPTIVDSKKLENKIYGLSSRMNDDLRLLNELVKSVIQPEYENGYIKILKSQIINHTLLYHVLSSYGINRSQAQQMFNNIDKIGNLFHSNEYEVLVDRDYLLIRRMEINMASQGTRLNLNFDELPLTVSFEKYSISVRKIDEIPNPYDNSIAIFPYRLLKNKQVYLRHWNKGDVFYPFGMKGKKQSLKKYFANQKLDRFRKSSIPILCVDKDIVWICGFRTDHRYRILESDEVLIQVHLL